MHANQIFNIFSLVMGRDFQALETVGKNDGTRRIPGNPNRVEKSAENDIIGTTLPEPPPAPPDFSSPTSNPGAGGTLPHPSVVPTTTTQNQESD